MSPRRVVVVPSSAGSGSGALSQAAVSLRSQCASSGGLGVVTPGVELLCELAAFVVFRNQDIALVLIQDAFELEVDMAGQYKESVRVLVRPCPERVRCFLHRPGLVRGGPATRVQAGTRGAVPGVKG
jgi:hypothetical protein